MPEGTALNPGTLGDGISDEDITGQPRLNVTPSVPVPPAGSTNVKVERTKIALGPFGQDWGDVADANSPLPVDAPALRAQVAQLLALLTPARRGSSLADALIEIAAILRTGQVKTLPQTDEVEGLDAVGATPTQQPLLPAYLDTSGNIRYPTSNVVAGGGFGGPTAYCNVANDLESFRDDFPGTNLATSFTGTCIFNASSTVVGAGTTFVSQATTADTYVRLSSDPESAWTKLAVQPLYDGLLGNNTRLLLSAPYSGTGGSGTGQFSLWKPTTGSGGTIAVGMGAATTSELALSTGTTNGAFTFVQHGSHYVAPLNITVYAKVSQAIANQEFAIGIVDNIVSPNIQTLLIFNGTDNTKVSLRTSQVNATVETNIGTLPNSLTTASYVRYRICCSTDGVVLFANDLPIARNKLHLPSLYQPQPLTIAAYNTGVPAGNTNLIVDAIGINSQDILEVESATTQQPAPVQVTGYDSAGTYQQASVNTQGALSVFSERSVSGTIANNGDIVLMALEGLATIGIRISSAGGFTGTIQFEGSIDGTNFVNQSVFIFLNGNLSNSATSATNVGSWKGNVGGLQAFRCRASSWSSGSATVALEATVGAAIQTVLQGNNASSANSWTVKITDSLNGPVAVKASNTPPVTTDAAFVVTQSPVGLVTYSATATITVAALATDIFTLTGSGTKTVRVTRVYLSGTQTAAAQVLFQLIKRSAANTGGTSSAVTAVAHDSASAAATATVLAYTVNPAGLGAAVGTVRAKDVFIPALATTSTSDVAPWDFGGTPRNSLMVKGTAEVVAVNLNGVTVTGGSITCTIEWTEE